MRHSIIKVLSAGLVIGAMSFAFGTGVQADDLDAETPCAGMSVVLGNYMDTVENSETQIVGLLPQKVESVEPARNPIFDNMAIAFVDNYVNVRKSPSTKGKIVGKIYSNCSATILDETADGWYKIKSGNVTGYIKSDYFLTGADAEEYAIEKGYVLATVKEAGLRVRLHAGTDQKIITNVYEKEIYAVKKYKQSGKWAKIALGKGVSGWVSADYIDMSVNMDTAVTLKEEKAMLKAEAQRKKQEEESRQAEIEAQQQAEEASRQAAQQAASQSQQVASQPQQQEQSAADTSSQNKTSSSYSKTSTSSTPSQSSNSSGSAKGAEVVAYAKQFLGNPYVWGGSSLTNGTDCSGFTMSVYAHFGYSINRTSYTQIYNGTSVSLDSVQPGDLIFYNTSGQLGHVALYIGGGQIIHASTPETGIIISSMYGNTPCAARRIIN